MEAFMVWVTHQILIKVELRGNNQILLKKINLMSKTHYIKDQIY